MHTKRFAFAFVAAALLIAGTAVPSHAQLGVAGGLNFESAGDIQTENASANLESSTGYHVGVIYELGLGSTFAIRPGLFYRRVGTFDLSGVSDELDELEDPRYTVTAWEIPVDLRVTLLSVPLLSPYIVGGPKATIPQGEDDFDEAVSDLSYTFNVGVGAQISIPRSSLRIQPEFRYEFGATTFIKEGKTVQLGSREAEFTPQDSPRFSTFALRVNLLF